METENKIFSIDNINQLSGFFNDKTEFTFIEFVGYCVGVSSAPRACTTAQWQNIFLGEATFATPEQEQEIRNGMELLYEILQYELTAESYTHTFFSQLSEPELSETDAKAIMYQWMSGYWLGLQIGGQEWTNSGLHQDALIIIFAIDAVCEQLQEETRFVTPDDIAIIQANVKLFFDYWHENRGPVDESLELEFQTGCCESNDCDEEDMSTECAPTDCNSNSENSNTCC